MSNRKDASGLAWGFDLEDIPPPSENVRTSLASQTGKAFTPAQQIATYSPDDWEDFILEWSVNLFPSFTQVKKIGGSGDRGIDVAAFKTSNGFEGAWICYQAKHYKNPLTPSDAFPEMLKIFHFALDDYYILPDEYNFMAPQGCGATLNRKLSSPSHLRNWFLAEIDRKAPSCSAYTEEVLREIRVLAASTDFSMFRSVELHEMIVQHQKTPYFSVRFGGPLPQRPAIQPAPAIPAASETRYVKKLLDVYQELDPLNCTDAAMVSAHKKYGPHLQRQREAFYSAESLRRYARDSVPEGTYEELQDDVYFGVIDTAESSYQTGMDRLQAVMKQAGQLELNNLVLIAVTKILDRLGICQQLANDDRLTWVE